MLPGKENYVKGCESCCDWLSSDVLSTSELGSFWYCFALPHFLCLVSIPYSCGWLGVHLKQSALLVEQTCSEQVVNEFIFALRAEFQTVLLQQHHL